MEEIKSIRVRINNSKDLDFKLTLYRISKSIRKIITPIGLKEMIFGELFSNKSDDFIINEYLVSMVKLNYLPNDYQIVQEVWSEIPPMKRTFGFEPYFINNGSRIYINWFKNGNELGGDIWSDEKGNELNETKSGDSKNEIYKTIKIISDDNIIMKMNANKEIVKTLDSEEFKFDGLILDKDILNLIISNWKKKIPNYELEICDPSNEFCKIIEYLSPINKEEYLPDNKEDNIISEQSKSSKEKINIVLPSDLKAKVNEDLSIKIYVGDSNIVQNLPGFQFGDEFEEDLSLLSDEYKEKGFEGEELALIDNQVVVLFNTLELMRDEEPYYGLGAAETGDNNIETPNNSVSDISVTLPLNLKNVRGSSKITKKSMGNGKYKNINTDMILGSKTIKGNTIAKNMNEFVSDVLSPFATFLKNKYPTLYKNWIITSATRGYRPTGGSTTSRHYYGQAIDSQILGSKASNPEKNIELLNAILEWYQKTPVGYDQILFETRKNSCWIHWSYKRNGNRLIALRFKDDSTLRSAKFNTSGKYVLPSVSKSLLGL